MTAFDEMIQEMHEEDAVKRAYRAGRRHREVAHLIFNMVGAI